MRSMLATPLVVLCLAAFPQTCFAQADISGKWSGSFDTNRPDGEVQHDTAILILKQEGSAVTGSVGPNEQNQSPIENGKISGSDVQWSIGAKGGRSMTFHLRLAGDHLDGSVTGEAPDGPISAKLDAVRGTGAPGANASPPSDLYEQIARADGALFDAYNKADLGGVAPFFTNDLEFYHDRSGLSNRQQTLDGLNRGFVSATKVRRELVPGSLEVYPLHGFGAVEIGIHRFFSTAPGQKERLTATAKFVQVWKKTDSGWQLARVVSYDHR